LTLNNSVFVPQICRDNDEDKKSEGCGGKEKVVIGGGVRRTNACRSNCQKKMYSTYFLANLTCRRYISNVMLMSLDRLSTPTDQEI